jgi:deoxyribodipyrimidine photo-lyase
MNGMPSAPALVWFRRDLRLADNPALTAAARLGPVLPFHILEDQTEWWAPRGASGWWLPRSLAALARDLADRGLPLILRRGSPREVIADLARSCGATAVFFNRRHEPAEIEAERSLHGSGLELHAFNGTLLTEPSEPPPGIFQAFRRRLSEAGIARPLPVPETLSPPPAAPFGEPLKEFPAAPWEGLWIPGEAGAHRRLEDFLSGGLEHYHVMRDRPDQPGTSRLSPHLHFGEISVRQVWHAAAARDASGCEAFLRELAWREFAYHLLHHNPTLPDQPLKPEFARFEWAEDVGAFAAWAEGRTGFPIIDAAMRAMRRTGWMHNRARMIVGSFLIKDLLLPWQLGERLFRDSLVDADLANNALGWQWVAGCGADAAPYFRVFNPVLQGEKFDPRGRYVRQWVPELQALPDLYIHRPWEAPPEVLVRAGVTLGETYPRPIVDHGAARRRALLAYERARGRGAA